MSNNIALPLIVQSALSLIAAASMACDPADSMAIDGRIEQQDAIDEEPDTSAPDLVAIDEVVNDYIAAIRQMDDGSVRELLSSEFLEALDVNDDGDVSGPELRRFAASESRKMDSAFKGDGDRVTVERFELLRGGRGAEVWLAHRGIELTKPQYLVLEDGEWRYGSGSLLQERSSTSNYKVKNLKTYQLTVSCSGGKSVSPAGLATQYINCKNFQCGASWGTNFNFNGPHACQYNAWGVDFYLNANWFGSCADDC